MRLQHLAPLFAALAMTAAPREAHAEHGRGPAPAPAPPRSDTGSLRDRLGIPVATRLMQSDEPADRIRGIARLGALGTPEAIDALVDQLDQGAVAARDPRARLEAVRVLAAFTAKDNVRQVLTREATDTSTAEGRGAFTPLGALIRGTAALALARGGDKKSVAALINALLQGNAASESAARALHAYPPTSLASFLEGRRRITPSLAVFLGELGDLRVLDRLRAMLEERDQATQVAAAVALGRLGDTSTLTAARAWLKKSEPRLRRAAAEVLLTLHAPEAPAAVVALLSSDATRADGLNLAFLLPSPEFAEPLLAALPSFSETQRPQAVAAIGRAGGPKAIDALVTLLSRPDLATAAAHALATMPDEGARSALERGLDDVNKKGEARRLLLRAAIVRALVLRDPPAGLRTKLEALLAAQVPADRAVAAFGLVATGARAASDLLDQACTEKACDAAVLNAASRGALAGRPRDLDALLPILIREVQRGLLAANHDQSIAEAPSLLASAAAVALLAHPDGGALPTTVLATWAESGGPLAPLAARALPSRDDEALRGRIKRLLEGSDPVVRAHIALGLARDPEPSAVSLLTQAYRFEDNADVRRAIIRALSHRTEAQRTAVLTLARDLDPDDDVRSLARSALAGRDLEHIVHASGGVTVTRALAWIAVIPNDGTAAVSARSARLVRDDGLSIPVVSDPDGVLLVPGLPPGPAQIQLAPR